MANKITLKISLNKQRPSRPWQVKIPRSLNGGSRKTPSFETKVEAQEFADAFVEGLIEGGAKEAVSQGDNFLTLWKDYKRSTQAKSGDRQEETFNYHEKRFLQSFSASAVNTLTVKKIERFLHSHGWAERSRFNSFSYLRSFLNWCERRGYITENPCDVLGEEVKKPRSPKNILSVLEMKVVLHCTKKDEVLRSFVSAGGFAGLRTDEQHELNIDKHFDWEDKEIHVPPDIIKQTEHRGGMRERYVKMTPAFIRNMPKNREGKLIPYSIRVFQKRRTKLVHRVRAMLTRIGAPEAENWDGWPDNCLRHTYASALLAVTKDAWLVAHELGHENTKTIHKDYARAMKERDAKAYFEL